MLELLRGLGTPCLGTGRIKEIFLDSRFDGQGQTTVQLFKLFLSPGVICSWNRNSELYCTVIGIFLVPCPAHRVPGCRADSKESCEPIPVTGEGCNRFISSWKKYPSPQPVALTYFHNALNGIFLVAQVLQPHDPIHIPREL